MYAKTFTPPKRKSDDLFRVSLFLSHSSLPFFKKKHKTNAGHAKQDGPRPRFPSDELSRLFGAVGLVSQASSFLPHLSTSNIKTLMQTTVSAHLPGDASQCHRTPFDSLERVRTSHLTNYLRDWTVMGPWHTKGWNELKSPVSAQPPGETQPMRYQSSL